MSRVLYKADNISVIGEICLGNCTTATQNNTNYWLKLFFTIFINGKLKTFNSDFTFQTIKGEIDNINLCKFGDVLNLLDDLGYPIKEVRDDGLNYTGSIITKWIHSFVIGQDGDKLIFE